MNFQNNLAFKKVLMIAYIYPPLGGSGVQRTLKFSKYLPQFGWQPLVVCGDDPEIFATGTDDSLLADIPPEAYILRKPFISPFGLRRRVQRWSGITPKFTEIDNLQKPNTSTGTSSDQEINFTRRFFNLLSKPLSPIEFPPIDAGLYWAFSIIPLCLRIIKEQQVDLIYSSSFPYSDHLAGLILKRMTNKPWVADFRDPWSQNPASRNKGWRRNCDIIAENWVLKQADKIIGVTPSYTKGLRELAPFRQAIDSITIENGYDNDDFPRDKCIYGFHRDISNHKVTLAHVGHVYNGTAIPLFHALKELGPEGRNLEIKFIGGFDNKEKEWIINNDINLQIIITERLSHDEAIKQMLLADFLLLLIGEGDRWKGHYPGKLFEYMHSGRLILMVGPEGVTSEFLRSTGTGVYIPTNDLNALVNVLQEIVNFPDQYFNRHYNPQKEIIERFERRQLTSRLASVFDDLVNHNQ